MSMPGMSAAPKKPILQLVGIACLVVGVLLAGFFAWRIVQTAPRTPQPIDNGRVHLSKEGLTIYSSVPVLAPPCKVQDADGNDVPTKRPSGSETITVNGNSWYVVARSAEPVPAGDYSISCTDDETSATYAAGPKSSVLAFVLSILGTVFSLLIFIGLGVTLLAVGIVRKNRRNRPTNTFPGPPPNTYQPPNYANPTQTFPTPPPYNPGPNPDHPQNH